MDELTEAELSHEIYLNRLASFYANKFDDLEPELIKAIRFVFAGYDDIPTKVILNEINQELEEALDPILTKFVEEQEQAIGELAEQEVEFQSELFADAGLIIETGAIAGAVTYSIRSYNNSFSMVGIQGSAEQIKKKLSAYPLNTISQIKDFVDAGYAQGQNITDVRTAITGTNRNKFNDGYLATAKRNAKSIIKTARKQMESNAKTAIYKKAGTDGYVLSAVLDSRTSDICLGWNGTIILWGDKKQPKPPFHFNCRTTMLPYFKGQTEVPEGGFEWLKKQSAAFQDDLIGPTRGDLLRNSGLTSEEFRKASRNNLNEPITLEEMARKNKEIRNRLNKT